MGYKPRSRKKSQGYLNGSKILLEFFLTAQHRNEVRTTASNISGELIRIELFTPNRPLHMLQAYVHLVKDFQ